MAKKQPRIRVRKSIRTRLAEFYEGDKEAGLNCVVSGKDDDVTLHHLDEDPSHSEIEYNIIPLYTSLNTNIDKREHRILDHRLTTGALSSKAKDHFSKGRFPQGYGCSVLGAWLNYNPPHEPQRGRRYHLNEEDAAFFAANSLVNLRPTNRIDYATYLLRSLCLPLVLEFGESIEKVTRARLLMEIGSYYRDAALYKRAMDFIQFARHILGKEPKSPRVRTILARLLQHEGIVSIIEGDHDHAKICFKKANNEITSDYSVGHANEALYQAEILLKAKKPDLDAIATILRSYPISSNATKVTKWTAIELRLRKAQAEFLKGTSRSKRAAYSIIRNVLNDIRKWRVIPTFAIFPPSLYAFADEFLSHKMEIVGLRRVLSSEFKGIASQIEGHLKKLSI